MQKLSTKQRLGLILLGIFLCLVVLEIGLRLGGFIILSLREHKNRLALKEKGAYRIMCLGGSTTADGDEYSYPSQLEEVLNEKNIGIRFKVINKGVESVDSTFILSKLWENLDKYNPDMVITMMGENDSGNTLPYEDTLDLEIKLFFRGFRVYKLANLLRMHIVNKIKEFGLFNIKREIISSTNTKNPVCLGDFKALTPSSKEIDELVATYVINKSQRNFEVAERGIKKAIEMVPDNVELYILLADGYIVQQRFKEAEEVLKKAIEIKPNSSRVYDILAFSYWSQERYSEAEEVFKKAIGINPKDTRAYSDLTYCYEKQGKLKEIQELCENIMKSNLRDAFFCGFIATHYSKQGKQEEAEKYYKKVNKFRLQYYNPATRHNYRKLKEIVIQRGIKLICVQHPMRSVEPLKKLFDSTEGIIFVDNENIFKEVLRHGKYDDYFRDCFAGDFGHCTPKGNRLLAENIANVILKEYFDR